MKTRLKILFPKFLSDTIHIESHATNTSNFILQNPKNHRYVQVGEKGQYLVEQMNGKNSVHDLIILMFTKFGVMDPQTVINLVASLNETEMIESIRFDSDAKMSITHFCLMRLKALMEYKISIRQVDQKMTVLYESVYRYCFSRLSLMIMSICIFFGMFFYFSLAGLAVSELSRNNNDYYLLLTLYPMSFVIVGLHELAHAMTTKYYKRSVLSFGIGWYWFTSVAFCNTSDMWFATHRQRFWVSMSGIINDLFWGGLASLFATQLSFSLLTILFWLYASLCYLNALFNLNTIFEFDGYYALSDIFNKHQLRQEAIQFILNLRVHLKSKNFMLEHKVSIIYWMMALGYFVINIGAVWLFQKYILLRLLPSNLFGSTPVVGWILPITVLLFFIVMINIEIRRAKPA